MLYKLIIKNNGFTRVSLHMIALLICVIFLSGCDQKSTNNGFYSAEKKADLWRVPLIEPYEFISPTNTSDDWFLIINKPAFNSSAFYSDKDEFQLSYIESAGIKDSVIVVHSENVYWPERGESTSSTLIIDTKTERKYLYSNTYEGKKISAILAELGITDIHLFPLETIVKQYQYDKKWPGSWYKQ